MITNQERSQDPRFLAWITETCPTFETAYGHCHQVAAQMVEAFPELRIAKGFYYDLEWGRRQHGWCVDPAGRIVDPTAHQFPSMGLAVYEELSAEEIPLRVPTGRCPDCGSEVYQNRSFCDDECQRSFETYMGM